MRLLVLSRQRIQYHFCSNFLIFLNNIPYVLISFWPFKLWERVVYSNYWFIGFLSAHRHVTFFVGLDNYRLGRKFEEVYNWYPFIFYNRLTLLSQHWGSVLCCTGTVCAVLKWKSRCQPLPPKLKDVGNLHTDDKVICICIYFHVSI